MADRYLSISFAQNTGYMSHYSQVIFREVFWHEYDKIPRHTGQNAITEGDWECILTKLLRTEWTVMLGLPQEEEKFLLYKLQIKY